jgi:transcriptional regulator with XRE-family HTH domain
MAYNDAQLVELGKLIKNNRKQMNLTVRATADKAEITGSYIAMLETGKNPKTGRPSRPSYDVLSRLDTVLGLGDEAYRLAGYIKRTVNSTDTKSQWDKLLESYLDELRDIFEPIEEGRKGKILEELSDLIKKYKPSASTQL